MSPRRTFQSLLSAGAFLGGFLPCVTPAHAVTMTANYYTISSSDPDTQQGIDGPFSNEVLSNLGPNMLPVLNTAYGGQTIFDVNSNGELTYWSPSFNSHVTATGTGTINLPYNNGSLFPPNGTGSGNGGTTGFQSAVFSTTLNVPTAETINFTVGADDNAFVYLDGTIVCDLGGVHADTPGTCTTMTMAAGNHTLELFYADLHTTQAALDFSINTANVTSVAPEPSSLLLLATGLLGSGLTLKRRVSRS